MEIDEIKRLFAEIQINKNDLLDSQKLLGIFCNQLSIRLNNKKNYEARDIALVLKDFAWEKRK
jgi:hypothetical protein